MPDHELSRAADTDLGQIGRQSGEAWGVVRAEAYLLALHRTFQHLAAFPDSGRRADDVRRGYLRFESGRHVVFDRKMDAGVLIVRVLHWRMLPTRYPDAD